MKKLILTFLLLLISCGATSKTEQRNENAEESSPHGKATGDNTDVVKPAVTSKADRNASPRHSNAESHNTGAHTVANKMGATHPEPPSEEFEISTNYFDLADSFQSKLLKATGQKKLETMDLASESIRTYLQNFLFQTFDYPYEPNLDSNNIKSRYFYYVYLGLPDFVTAEERHNGYYEDLIESIPSHQRLMSYTIYRLGRSKENVKKIHRFLLKQLPTLLSKERYEDLQLDAFIRQLLSAHQHIVSLNDSSQRLRELYKAADSSYRNRIRGGYDGGAYGYGISDQYDLYEKYLKIEGSEINIYYFSFWVRRAHEGNAEEVLRLLKDVQQLYGESVPGKDVDERSASSDEPPPNDAIDIPDGYQVLQQAVGDLDKDGVPELVTVFNYTKADMGNGYFREIRIYRARGNVWVPWQQLRRGILDSESGGVWGDPFDQIRIQRGALVISHYGGSSSRWGYTHRYRFQDDAFRLIGVTVDWDDTHCNFNQVLDINLSTARAVYTEKGSDCAGGEVDTTEPPRQERIEFEYRLPVSPYTGSRLPGIGDREIGDTTVQIPGKDVQMSY